MIQLIQTVYLLLAGVATLLMLVFDFAAYNQEVNLEGASATIEWTVGASGITAELEGHEIEEAGEVEQHFSRLSAFFQAGRTAIIALGFFSLILIFLYKNRKVQSTLTMLNLVFHLLALVLMIGGGRFGEELLMDEMQGVFGDAGLSFSPLAGYFMPAVSCALLFLAWRAIRRTEKLVRSVDRIR